MEGEHPNVHAVACYREVTGAEDAKKWLLQRFPEQLGVRRGRLWACACVCMFGCLDVL